MPKTEPVCSAKRRPKALARIPTGSVPAHMPTAMTLIGSVASAGSGARMAPAIPPVATITLALAPASACATASTSVLCFANRSSTPSVVGSAKTAMEDRHGLVSKAATFLTFATVRSQTLSL